MSLSRSRRQIRCSRTLILIQFAKQKVGVQIIKKQTNKKTVQVLGLHPAKEEQFMSSTGFTTCRPSAECAPGLFTATVEITALSAGGVYSRHIPDLFSGPVFGKYTSSSGYLLLSSFSLLLLRPLSDETILPVRPKSLSSCFHALSITFNIYFYFDWQPFTKKKDSQADVTLQLFFTRPPPVENEPRWV